MITKILSFYDVFRQINSTCWHFSSNIEMMSPT